MRFCAEFSLFPDDWPLGANFIHSNFRFSSKNGTIINVQEQDGEKAITINPSGIVVDLPVPRNRVDFRVGIWDNNDITVTAKDSNGNTVGTPLVITVRNSFMNASIITKEEIVSVEFDTNGDEELLVSICVDL